MKRKLLTSPRLLELKRRRRKVFLSKILLSLFSLLLIFITLSYISRLEQLNISGAEITGNKVLDENVLKATVEEQIAGNYLWIFPKTNILIYPKNSMQKELFSRFKRLKNIDFSIAGGRTLQISITEREQKYLWCGPARLASESVAGGEQAQQCYFMDETGYIFDEAPYFSGEVYFKFYGSSDAQRPTSDISLPGAYFAKENFERLISFKKILEEMGLKTAAMSLVENGDVKITLSKANLSEIYPELILKIDSDFQKMVENLEAALSTEPMQSKFKNKYSKLQYIDLRFGNKVYFKFNE